MKHSRQIIIWFLTAVILTSVFFVALPRPALAQTIYPGCEIEQSEKSTARPIIINFSLPGITTEKKVGDKIEYQVKNLPCFIIGLYTYFAGVAGILATVMVMYGGAKYVVSFGSPQRVSDAKDTIFAAISGLVLILGSYILLNFINPNLTELKMPNIPKPEKIEQHYAICDSSATPEVSGKTSCGAIGYYTDQDTKCMYDTCLQPLKSDEYDPYFDGPYVCAQGSPDNPDQYADKWFCMTARQRCERWDDTREGVGIGRHDSMCNKLSIEGKGKCKWYDMDWEIPGTPGSQITTDRCRWWGLLECDPYNWGIWFRVGCDACNAAGDDGVCPPIMTKVGNLPVISWITGLVINLSGTESNVVCEADSKTPVYYSDSSSDGQKMQGICCRRNPLIPSTYRCYNGQDYDNFN